MSAWGQLECLPSCNIKIWVTLQSCMRLCGMRDTVDGMNYREGRQSRAKIHAASANPNENPGALELTRNVGQVAVLVVMSQVAGPGTQDRCRDLDAVLQRGRCRRRVLAAAPQHFRDPAVDGSGHGIHHPLWQAAKSFHSELGDVCQSV